MKKTLNTLTLLLPVCLLLLARPALAQPYVCMETNVGEFCMVLFEEEAPATVANFLNYVEDGEYDGTWIHRSEPDFVIQGGGFQINPLAEPVPADSPVGNEPGVPNTRGTIAMAKRSGDPHSATSQWYINLADNVYPLDFSNGGYTVFGRILSGMEVVDRIGQSLRVDLNAALGSTAFGTVPVLEKPPGGIRLQDLLQVQRAYTTDILQDEKGPFTEFDGQSLSFPVRIGDGLYQATLNMGAASPTFVFEVDRDQLIALPDSSARSAHYSNADGSLSIPSVKNGANVFTDVVLQLTDRDRLEFTLVDFTPLQQ